MTLDLQQRCKVSMTWNPRRCQWRSLRKNHKRNGQESKHRSTRMEAWKSKTAIFERRDQEKWSAVSHVVGKYL